MHGAKFKMLVDILKFVIPPKFLQNFIAIRRRSEVTYCFKPCILHPDDGTLGPKHVTFSDIIRILLFLTVIYIYLYHTTTGLIPHQINLSYFLT